MAIQLDCFGARRLAMTVSGYTITESALFRWCAEDAVQKAVRLQPGYGVAVYIAMSAPVLARPLTNVEIAHRLAGYAQTLQDKGENPYKVRAYRRAAQTIKGLRESIDRLVRADADVTRFPVSAKASLLLFAKLSSPARLANWKCR